MAWMTQSSEACGGISSKSKDAGFIEAESLGDATETWISQSENFDVNNVTFSNYKNHTTGKTAV